MPFYRMFFHNLTALIMIGITRSTLENFHHVHVSCIGRGLSVKRSWRLGILALKYMNKALIGNEFRIYLISQNVRVKLSLLLKRGRKFLSKKKLWRGY